MTITERNMLDRLLDLEEGLTEWECNFVSDLDKRDRARRSGIELSPKQSALLEKLWREKCP